MATVENKLFALSINRQEAMGAGLPIPIRNIFQPDVADDVVYEITAPDVYAATSAAKEFAKKWGILAFSLRSVTHFDLVFDYIAEEDGHLP